VVGAELVADAADHPSGTRNNRVVPPSEERERQMTSVVVLGPNLHGSNSTFHVHAAGCADIKRNAFYRSPEFNDDKRNPLDFNSVEEIAEYVYDFEENPRDLVNDFEVFPCVHFTKEETMPVATVEFEVYTDDFWVSFSVETTNPDVLVQNLLKLKNTRGIHIV
jgi:hypothetical protein